MASQQKDSDKVKEPHKMSLQYNCKWCNRKYSRVEKYIAHAKKDHNQELTMETVGLPGIINKNPSRPTYSEYGNILVACERAEENRDVIGLIKGLAEKRVRDIEAGIFTELDASQLPVELRHIEWRYLKRAIDVQVETQLASKKPEEKEPSYGKKECNICCSADINAAIYPCGHAFACYQCSTKVQTCAACRGAVGKVIKLYVV